MSNAEECFRKRLLIKAMKSKSIALNDLKQSEFFLGEALDMIELKKKEMAIMALYQSVFHAGRSILFIDGVKEKSHYCLQKYLEEKYGKAFNENELALFDLLRGMREEIQYNATKTSIEENLNELAEKTEKFIEKTKKIINSKNTQNKN